MQCPGCGQSYCLDCEKSVDPRLFRCDPCLQEYVANDPFAASAREAGKEAHESKEEIKKLKKAADFVYERLCDLQKVIHGSADQEIRDSAFHSTIAIRNFVQQHMLYEKVPPS